MEYAYIVNFDTKQLEFYIGNNQSGILNNDKLGRYHQLTSNIPRYNGIVLVTTISFNQIKQLSLKEIIIKVISKYNKRKKYLTIANQKAIIDCKHLNPQEIFNTIINTAINEKMQDISFNTTNNPSNNTISVKFLNRQTKKIKYLVNCSVDTSKLLLLAMKLGNCSLNIKELSEFSITLNNENNYCIRCSILTLDNMNSQINLRILER